MISAGGKPLYDLRPFMTELTKDEDIEKVVVMYLSRIYSVFNPAKLTEVSTLMAKYHDNRNRVSLACAVAAQYLEKSPAEALFQPLVSDFLKGKRTELDWCPDLEIANRSPDQAIIQMDERKRVPPLLTKKGPRGSASGVEQKPDTSPALQTARPRVCTGQRQRRGKGKGWWQTRQADAHHQWPCLAYPSGNMA